MIKNSFVLTAKPYFSLDSEFLKFGGSNSLITDAQQCNPSHETFCLCIVILRPVKKPDSKFRINLEKLNGLGATSITRDIPLFIYQHLKSDKNSNFFLHIHSLLLIDSK